MRKFTSRRGRVVAAAAVLGAGLSVLGAAPATADPGLSVDPSTGLTDGQTVTVSGTGFTPGVSLLVAECDLVNLLCNFADIVPVTADADGSFSVTIPARRAFQGTNPKDETQVGAVDCATASCGFGAADFNDPGENPQAALSGVISFAS